MSSTHSFKVGDIVIGLPSASKEYGTTTEGWMGRVIEVRPHEIDAVAMPSSTEEDIDRTVYRLIPGYFRLALGSEVEFLKDIYSVPVRKPKITKDQRQEAQELTRTIFNFSANFIVFKDNGESHLYAHQPCHGALGKRGNRRVELIYSMTNAFDSETDTYDKKFLKNLKKYYTWLLKVSPYRVLFLNKTVKSAETEGLWARTDVPSNFLLGGLIASRYYWERQHIIELMFKLADEGVNTSLAFIIAHLVNKRDDDVYTVAASAPEEHAISVNHTDRELILNFMSGSFKNPNINYGTLITYKGVFGLWSGSEEEKGQLYPASVTSFRGELESINDKFHEGKVWGERNITPAMSFHTLATWAKALEEEVL